MSRLGFSSDPIQMIGITVGIIRNADTRIVVL